MKHSGLVGFLKFFQIGLGVFVLSLAISAHCNVWKENGAVILLTVSLASSSFWFVVFFFWGTTRLSVKIGHFANHMLGMLSHEIVTASLLASTLVDIGPNRRGHYGQCSNTSRVFWMKIIAASLAGFNCILHAITAYLFSQTIPSEVPKLPQVIV